MKVLVTGMASYHTGDSANTSFFGTLIQAIKEIATVTQEAPSVLWTKEYLDQYDSIVVGVTPPTSIGANKVYGALHLINLMYDSPKLVLVVDTPQVWQFKSSLNAVAQDVSTIFTPFYSKRREYRLAKSTSISNGIQEAAKKLISLPWPKTIYPQVPWKTSSDVAKFISKKSPDSLIGVNLDSFLLSETSPSQNYNPLWAVDNQTALWTRKIEKLLRYPTTPLKRNPKDSDDLVFQRIASSFGLLIVPQDRGVGTWWSYRYIQALNAEVPIVSDWKDTGRLATSWYVLGSSLEEFSDEQRRALANAQRTDYIKSIPTKEESIELVKSILMNTK